MNKINGFSAYFYSFPRLSLQKKSNSLRSCPSFQQKHYISAPKTSGAGRVFKLPFFRVLTAK